jgi:RNA polymerase sigma-70 factor (ECF subfamily)
VERGTDSELMMRVKQGHTGELGILFERHHERLLNYCMRMTGSRQASEDLVQEVFVRMLRYRDSFRGGEGGFLPWMYTLARNACIDHGRRDARRRDSAPVEHEPISGEPTVSDRMEKEQSIRTLRQALMRLPAEKREVLVLSRFKSMKFEDVARIVGCPVGTAKVRAHRALRELREIYHGLLSEAAL